jgi:hypothetical protein
MKLPVHPQDILFENDDLKKLDPECFRIEIQTKFIKATEIGSMNLRINDREQTVLLASDNPFPMAINNQDTILIKIPIQEIFEMLKRGISSGKIDRRMINARLRFSNFNPNALNE